MGMGGTQRAAKFVKYLPQFHWNPIVITVKDVRYYAHDMTLLHDVNSRTIIRTGSLDPLRLLALFQKAAKSEKKNRVPSAARGVTTKLLNFLNRLVINWLFVPDSKILWLPFALRRSLAVIKSRKIRIIFTTSPPHSVHLGGMILKLMSGAKWVADFRDDWTGGESQASPTFLHTFFHRLAEKFVLKYADRVIGMCEHLTLNLKKKSGQLNQPGKFVTIMNGYDRDDFAGLTDLPLNSRFTITHCGSISRVSDPEAFLTAIQRILMQQPGMIDKIHIQFFGTDIFGRLDSLLKQLKLQHLIPPIRYLPHRQALAEIMKSHLLLLIINKISDEEIITGKLFEYLASGKPILLISSPGEVARMIGALNRGIVVENNNVAGIQQAILKLLSQHERGEKISADPLSLPQFDRRILTGQVAAIFAEMVADNRYLETRRGK